MKWLFRLGKKSNVLTTEQAEAQLVEATQMLNKKQEKLERDIDHQLKMAKHYGTKHKKRWKNSLENITLIKIK